MDILDWVFRMLLVIAAVPAVGSWLLHLKTPWKRTEYGKHLFWYMGSIAAVLVISAIDLFIRPDPLWFEALQAVVFVGVPITLWWRFALQIKARRHLRKEAE